MVEISVFPIKIGVQKCNYGYQVNCPYIFYLKRLAFQIFSITPISPHVPNSALSCTLQKTQHTNRAFIKTISKWDVGKIELLMDNNVSSHSVSYHRLQSLGKMISLQAVFAFLQSRAIDQSRAVIDRLIYRVKGESVKFMFGNRFCN